MLHKFSTWILFACYFLLYTFPLLSLSRRSSLTCKHIGWIELNPLLFVAITFFWKQFARNWALRSQIFMLKILENKFLRKTSFWTRRLGHAISWAISRQKKRVLHKYWIHRTIYKILLPPSGWDLITLHHPPRRVRTGGVRKCQQPNFLGWIVYETFLPMELGWRAARARESSAMISGLGWESVLNKTLVSFIIMTKTGKVPCSVLVSCWQLSKVNNFQLYLFRWETLISSSPLQATSKSHLLPIFHHKSTQNPARQNRYH